MADTAERLRAALADRYHLERELGAGGMATVYLATDLRHERQVALKVLRSDLAAALGAERFHREIHIAAQLQHPHILPLLDSGDAGGFLYYTMPFIEGHSLRERLAREGALPIADAVRILRDVADALTEAHAHGVVHRDIKPENIMLRGRHALVMDFGVAKAISEATGRQTLTTAGVAIGTPAYMAPEQATADPHLDHRVDLYAVGAVGYELLTGRPVFMGTTPQMVLSAHVTEAPVPITRHRDTVPKVLEALVMRCLEKKPADRPQSAEEVLAQLEALATPSGGITPTQTVPVEAAKARRRLMSVASGAGAIALAAVAVLMFQLLRPKPLTITLEDIRPVTSDPGVEFQPAISPDGNEVAFAAGPIGRPRLYVRSIVNIAGGGALRLGDTASGSEWAPAWSPDGQAVRYVGCRAGAGFGGAVGLGAACTMNESGKLGGGIRLTSVPPGSAHAWSLDGSRVAFVRFDTILIASTADTTLRRAAVHTTGFGGLHSLAWSPDGRRIAYVNGNQQWLRYANILGASIWVVTAEGGVPREVVGGGHMNVSPTWLDAHHLLFVSNRDGPRGVYVIDVGSDGARGEPRPVPGVTDPHSISYSIASHRLAFARLTLRQNIWTSPLAPGRPPSIRSGRPVTTANQVIEALDLSPDGRWLAYNGSLRGSGSELYRLPLSGGEALPLTDTPVDEFGPRWSPDGREIAFYASSAAGPRIYVMPAQGGVPVRLTDGSYDHSPAWRPDGLWLSFFRLVGNRGRVWYVSRDSVGGRWSQPAQLADFRGIASDWAPDGSGYVSSFGDEQDPRLATLVMVGPDGKAVRRPLPAARRLLLGQELVFARDGRTIYGAGAHEDGRQGVWAIPVSGTGEPRLVLVFDDPAKNLFPSVAPALRVGPDRLYLTVPEYESDIWVATLRW